MNTLLLMVFSWARKRGNICCGHKMFCVLNKCCARGQTENICVYNIVSSFATTFKTFQSENMSRIILYYTDIATHFHPRHCLPSSLSNGFLSFIECCSQKLGQYFWIGVYALELLKTMVNTGAKFFLAQPMVAP